MTPDLDLVQLSADDTVGIEEQYLLQVACANADLPYDPPMSRRNVISQLAHPWEHHRVEHWLARDGREVVGEVSMWFPRLDNLDNVVIGLIVHPAHRRRGIGSRLGRHAIERTEAAGRQRIVVNFCTDSPAPGSGAHGAAAFATSLGATEGLVEIRRRLDLGHVDDSLYPRLLAEAERASVAYEITRWQLSMPDELIDQIAALEERMVTDAPMGDLAWEQEQHDANRMRAGERVLLGRGQRTYGAAVVHVDSGTVAGFTTCVMAEDVPEHANQGSTIVMPAHRGHRLGLRLKADTTIFMRSENPLLRTIDTWNAAENEHMIRVNDVLGYRPLDTWAEWQLELTP